MIIIWMHMFRVMIYMIAKLKWEHKSNNPYEYGCNSNTIHVCHKSNYHGIYHNNHETWHAKNQ